MLIYADILNRRKQIFQSNRKTIFVLSKIKTRVIPTILIIFVHVGNCEFKIRQYVIIILIVCITPIFLNYKNYNPIILI